MNENEDDEVELTIEMDDLLSRLTPILQEWKDKGGTISSESPWVVNP